MVLQYNIVKNQRECKERRRSPVFRTKSYVQHIASLLLFGLNGIIAGQISLNSYEIVWLRTLLGGGLLMVLFFGSRRKPMFLKNKRDSLFLALAGLVMGAHWMFLYEAFRQIGVGLATLLTYCGPVLLMIAAPVLFGEKTNAVKVGGFAAVMLGMVLINRQVLTDSGNLWGLFCGLMSAFLYAVMVVLNRQAKSIQGLENAMWQLGFGFVAVTVFIGFKQGISLAVDPADWLPILWLGLFHTGFGCFLYFTSLRWIPVQSVAVLGYLEPLSALLFSAVLLREVLTPLQWVGAVLILGGAFLGETLGRNRPSKRSVVG